MATVINTWDHVQILLMKVCVDIIANLVKGMEVEMEGSSAIPFLMELSPPYSNLHIMYRKPILDLTTNGLLSPRLDLLWATLIFQINDADPN